ncbi:MAG: M20 family peptidase, partial [Actinobacteria bacterium]|nr:M20 family peptidase [Actinomycetota bacterium]
MALDEQQIAALKARACADIDARAGDLIEASHEIHAHPELNYEERFAHDLLTTAIERAGLPVTRKAYGIDTAFQTNVGTVGLNAAVLLEYDALP